LAERLGGVGLAEWGWRSVLAEWGWQGITEEVGRRGGGTGFPTCCTSAVLMECGNRAGAGRVTGASTLRPTTVNGPYRAGAIWGPKPRPSAWAGRTSPTGSLRGESLLLGNAPPDSTAVLPRLCQRPRNPSPGLWPPSSRGKASWRSDLAVRLGGVTWRSDLAVWLGGVTWRSGLAEWLGGVAWRSGPRAMKVSWWCDRFLNAARRATSGCGVRARGGMLGADRR
jgi:hypothetical protein